MLNSVLNGDWSNSVPGRKIPEGDIGARCGDVCVWGSDVGDRAEVIQCDDISAQCGDIGAEFPAISVIAELV